MVPLLTAAEADLRVDGCVLLNPARAAMNLHTLDHEKAILDWIREGTPVSIEKALLILSGLETDTAIRAYQKKIDDIFGRFADKCDRQQFAGRSQPPPYMHRTIAQCLFDYLWNSKPKRFGESFLITEVVDAQLNPDLHCAVGTCVGLTSLYSVLGLRAGLHLTLLVTSDHLLNRLRLGQQTVDLDHTDPLGFDCPARKHSREFPLQMLAANVLNCRGLRNAANGHASAAKADYGKAIFVNPEYANAFNNRGNLRLGDQDLEGAIADYTEAIRLNPGFCEAYCNRGIAKHRLGRFEEARQDYHLAMETDAEYADARKCLQILDDMEHSRAPVK
ncbi:MAG TPA: hypothetical protein DEO88_02560 [Syntrophobacteraceae bacterium]|nr:hypothetical protein [Syntrophobacteraceae bacterium]